jgi:hypothetical protein
VTQHHLNLSLLPETFAICRLDAGSPIPAWALAAEGFVSITRTGDELSTVCPKALVPYNVQASRSWRCLRVAGPLDFTLVGVLASLASPLAAAGISIFALSTYETDYLLVREAQLPAAIEALAAAGHTVHG